MGDGFRLHRGAAVKVRPGRRPPPAPVTTIRINANVWRTALRLAGGDAYRIKVISAECVLVTNRPRRGKGL